MGNSYYKWSPKQRKYLDAQRKKNLFMETLYAYNNNLKEQSGIYILTRQDKPRQDGSVKRYCYIGQAVNVLDRLAGHYMGFEQRIDISLKTRGLKYPSNPYAWAIDVVYCSKEMLNQKEREILAEYIDKGYEPYNITSGGQDSGKEDINERKAGKKYLDGIKQGYTNCLKDVREYFEKYLEYHTKTTPECFKKPKRKGDLPTLKDIYVKKFNEFQKLLEEKTDDETM